MLLLICVLADELLLVCCLVVSEVHPFSMKQVVSFRRPLSSHFSYCWSSSVICSDSLVHSRPFAAFIRYQFNRPSVPDTKSAYFSRLPIVPVTRVSICLIVFCSRILCRPANSSTDLPRCFTLILWNVPL